MKVIVQVIGRAGAGDWQSRCRGGAVQMFSRGDCAGDCAGGAEKVQGAEMVQMLMQRCRGAEVVQSRSRGDCAGAEVVQRRRRYVQIEVQVAECRYRVAAGQRCRCRCR